MKIKDVKGPIFYGSFGVILALMGVKFGDGLALIVGILILMIITCILGTKYVKTKYNNIKKKELRSPEI